MAKRTGPTKAQVRAARALLVATGHTVVHESEVRELTRDAFLEGLAELEDWQKPRRWAGGLFLLWQRNLAELIAAKVPWAMKWGGEMWFGTPRTKLVVELEPAVLKVAIGAARQVYGADRLSDYVRAFEAEAAREEARKVEGRSGVRAS